MSVKYSLAPIISEKIKSAIDEYDGGEIFFGCLFDEEGVIQDAEPICYGNDEAVLAPYEIVSQYNAILHNHPSGNIKPSDQDLNYASFLLKEGIGFFITDNEASTLNTVVPPILNKKKKKLDIDFVKDLFAPGGALSKTKNDYEFREGQLKMACHVAESLNDNKISVVEAGTGIGKSLAYLIPAFLWAEKNSERIVIATKTINLQSQLLNNDIPVVQDILKSNINAILVKGRRNYLCKLKLYNMQNELDFDEDNDELDTILKWANTTENGVVDELNFEPAFSVWDKVSSEADFCLGRNCMFFSQCFFQHARRKASESNILIVNHHILFADISIRSVGRGLDDNSLLPPYRKIIIDEAHNIESSASSFFSYTFYKNAFYKSLSYLRSKNNKGFLPRLQRKLQKSSVHEVKELSAFLSDNLLNVFNYLFYDSFDIFDAMGDYFKDIIEKKNYNTNYKINIQHRIIRDEWESQEFKINFINHFRELLSKLEEFEHSFNLFYVKYDGLPQSSKNELELDIKLLRSYQNKLIAMQEELSKLLDIDFDEYVVWLDIFGDIDNLSFKFIASPLHINKLLCQHVYEVFDSIVFSSATVTVNKTFDYFKNISGLSFLKDKEIIMDSIDSPFDYKKNVLFVAPIDIPEPNSFEYNDKLNEFLKETIISTKGSAFVLFTSYNQLKKSYDDAGMHLNENGFRCFYQGEMEKTKLLDKFKIERSSNLFATSSFWEGVDAPGETLRYVVLAKLPFSMPTDPIEQAKIEDMEKRGVNSFLSYTLPSAVIRFKQGFGRLVRKKDDYGIVALLDSRVLRKSYGKLFFLSIPQCKFVSGNSDDVNSAILEHISNREAPVV